MEKRLSFWSQKNAYTRNDPNIAGEFRPVESTHFASQLDTQTKLDLISHERQQINETRAASPSEFAKSGAEFLLDRAIKDRARRSKFFPASLFADPAWDMMLELYRAEVHHYRVTVSSLCIASQVPATTALRWISTLERRGLLMRDADQLDRRRFFMRLTVIGSMAMTLYLLDEAKGKEWGG